MIKINISQLEHSKYVELVDYLQKQRLSGEIDIHSVHQGYSIDPSALFIECIEKVSGSPPNYEGIVIGIRDHKLHPKFSEGRSQNEINENVAKNLETISKTVDGLLKIVSNEHGRI